MPTTTNKNIHSAALSYKSHLIDSSCQIILYLLTHLPPPRPRFRVRKQSYSKRRMLLRWDMMLYIQSSFYLTSSPDSISTCRAALFFMTLCSWLSVLRRNARLKGSVRANSQRALWQLPHCTRGGSRWCP